MIDYYEILEVSPKASPEVIREVYKVLLHRYNLAHDSEDQSDVQKLRNIKLAYEVLSDPDKREIYDNDFFKARKDLDKFHRKPESDKLAIKNVTDISQVSGKASAMPMFKWKRWSWLVSVLAVVIVLISMVRPDPDKAMRGQLAVKLVVGKDKNGLEGEMKNPEVEKQATVPR